MEIKVTEKAPSPIEYPCLMVSVDTGRVVLMVEYGRGITFSNKKDNDRGVGQLNSFIMSCFTRFKGSVTLTQE